MNKTYAWMVVILIFGSCGKYDPNELLIIDYENALTESYSFLFLSDFADNVGYVPLETCEDIIIGVNGIL